MMRRNIKTLFIHLAGWLLFILLIGSFTSRNTIGSAELYNMVSGPYAVFFMVYIILFYLNQQLLWPNLYLQKKYIAYFGILLVLFVAVYFYKPFDRLLQALPHPPGVPPGERHSPPPPNGEERLINVDIVSVILFMMTCSVSMGIEIFKQWRSSEERAARAEADKANAELSFLKAQINPHFLFNTLNNIYTLAVTNHAGTPEAIMKLSGIMRYITEEATEDFVSLESEMECIENYIDLQKLRLSEKTSFSFLKKGDMEGKEIVPLVLMTFVENVFKYGISNHDLSDIKITCEVDQNIFHFYCRNKIFPLQKTAESTGIGLHNTRQRLEYAYPRNHELDINTDNGVYTVNLKIRLN
jgi:hypothetical protein